MSDTSTPLGRDLSLPLGTDLAAEIPEQISGLAAWFDSRSTRWMSFSSGFVCSAWGSRARGPDSIANAIATQGVVAGQPVWSPSVANLGNRPGLIYDGTNDVMDTATPGNWTFVHSGNGGLGAFILTVEYMDSTGSATQSVTATCNGTNTATGVFPLFGVANVSLRVCNGSGVFVQSWTNAVAAHFARNVPRWRGWSYVTGTQGSYVSGSSLTNADTGGAPSSGAPATALRIGGFGGVVIKGNIAQVLVYKRIPSAAEISRLGAWVNSIYPLAAA